MDRLTTPQLNLIRELQRYAKGVKFCGIDQDGLPVIQFTDARRTTDEFAIPRYNHHRGASRPPKYPLRWYDIDTIDPQTHEVLCSLR